MRPHHLMAATVLCACIGCGYGWVRPDQGPVARLHVGAVEDTSAQGDLGLVVADALRDGLAGRARPRLDPAGPALGGVIRVAADRPAAFDGSGAGLGAALQSQVTVTLTLRDRDAAPLWTGDATLRTARWLRAATPLETRDRRRTAIRAAAREATDDALAAFLTLPTEGS